MMKLSVVLIFTIISSIHCNGIDYKKANSILSGKQYRNLGHTADNVSSFISFMKNYGKLYENEIELKKRFHNFNMNSKKYKEIEAKDTGTAKYGISHFSDYSAEELSMYNGFNRKNVNFSKQMIGTQMYSEGLSYKPTNKTYPKNFDWRTKNVIGPVRKQGSCGSCWAFSATGCIEAQYAIKHGEFVELSKQQLVDCDPYDDGCEGGDMGNAYEYIMEVGGIETEFDYPYRGLQSYGIDCRLIPKEDRMRVKVLNYVNITTGEEDMKRYIHDKGPLSVALNADNLSYYLYGIGDFDEEDCYPLETDHAVLLVGYGEEEQSSGEIIPYWILKNSWGAFWGEEGYFRLRRGKNTCGIATEVTGVTVE